MQSKRNIEGDPNSKKQRKNAGFNNRAVNKSSVVVIDHSEGSEED
jgi:hypothetical protein